MSHSIHIGMPYVVHNEIQYINMRGRVVRKNIFRIDIWAYND